MTYKCRKCGAEFKSFHVELLPVCERCKREKEEFKIAKNSSETSKTPDAPAKGNIVAVIGLIAICFFIWLVLKGWGALTYWDKIYVPDNFNTYSSTEFKTVEKVKLDKDDQITKDITVYNKKTGEKKEITLQVPLYKIWTRKSSREKLDGKEEILSYKQPLINDGYDFIKPTDAIIEDTDAFNAVVQKAMIAYKDAHINEFTDWTFNKDEIKK